MCISIPFHFMSLSSVCLMVAGCGYWIGLGWDGGMDDEQTERSH